MAALETAEIRVKGFRSGLELRGGRVHLWNKVAKSDVEFPVTEILGVERKAMGLARGYLAVRTLSAPGAPSGTLAAQTHPMTVVVAMSAGSSAKEFEDLVTDFLRRHPPDASNDPYRGLELGDKAIQKQLDAAREHLDSGEVVTAVVLGAYETERFGADSVRNGVLMSTDKRLIFFAKKMMQGYDLESFPYEKISSFEQSKGMTGAQIKFFASGNKVQMKWINKGDLAGLVGYVRDRIESGHQSPPQAPARGGSVADKIRELAQLRDEGLLTEDEFVAKKQ